MPISFEWTFTGAVPPALGAAEHHRSRDGLRLDADIVRYHQIGTGAGWVEVDGARTELDGRRRVDEGPLLGRPLHGGRSGRPTCEDPARPSSVSTTVIWSPMLCERADGSRYGLHWYYQRHGSAAGSGVELQGGIEHPDGRREPFVALVARRSTVHNENRRLLWAELELHDGRRVGLRPITVAAWATPGSIWAPGSTSGSTGIGTASGGASCTSTGST